MDTPFERNVEPWLTRISDPADARAFVRRYIRLGRAEPFGGYGERFGGDLDLEGLAKELRRARGRETPETEASYRRFLDALWTLVAEGRLRPGPRDLLAPYRPTAFSVTGAGEAWLAADADAPVSPPGETGRG